jgi:hypothetical protein
MSMGPSRRSARWHTRALIAPGAGRALRAKLGKRYGCQVTTDVSIGACEAAAARLESSVSPARMAELAN